MALACRCVSRTRFVGTSRDIFSISLFRRRACEFPAPHARSDFARGALRQPPRTGKSALPRCPVVSGCRRAARVGCVVIVSSSPDRAIAVRTRTRARTRRRLLGAEHEEGRGQRPRRRPAAVEAAVVVVPWWWWWRRRRWRRRRFSTQLAARRLVLNAASARGKKTRTVGARRCSEEDACRTLPAVSRPIRRAAP